MKVKEGENLEKFHNLATVQSAGAVEYTDCISVYDPPQH